MLFICHSGRDTEIFFPVYPDRETLTRKFVAETESVLKTIQTKQQSASNFLQFHLHVHAILKAKWSVRLLVAIRCIFYCFLPKVYEERLHKD